MTLAHNSQSRRQSSLLHQHQHQHQHQPSYHQQISIPSTLQQPQPQSQSWIPSSLSVTPTPTFTTNSIPNNINFFGADQILFDFQPEQFASNQQVQAQPPLMQNAHANSSWLSNGQLTPTSISRQYHDRESSLSSLGSPAGPASPFAPSISNPQVAGDPYHNLHDFSQPPSKPLTPAHTPLQDHFLTPHYSNPNYYQNPNTLAFTMSQDGLPRHSVTGNELMPAPEFNSHGGSSRPSSSTVADNDSHPPSTPPSYEDERQKSARIPHSMPKLDRTMTDACEDELFNPNYPIISAPPATPASTQASATLSPRNDAFTRALQAANNQHLSANQQNTSTFSPRELSPFRQGSPLAPSSASFNTPNMRFGTATHLREQQKRESDALAMTQQLQREAPGQVTPKTISPKDVNLVYHENEDDANMPLFSPREQQQQSQQQQQQQKQSPVIYHQQPSIAREPSASEELSLSQQSYGSMATTRRESSSAYSTNSQTTPQQARFNFATPALPSNGNARQMPQHYPFVPQPRRQTSNMSNVTDDFPATLTSMESSSSEYSPENKSPVQEIKRPIRTSADSGTYTCTYHGCTLRFETPALLQKHKRECHRNSASLIGSNGNGGESSGGMTSAAQKLNSQSGPHKCERINPSTGKPCNTIFSRPYDLTRHEDTIHNAKKQKLRCGYCTEEKTFSRNDALTRHMRVVHPEIPITLGRGRRRGMGLGGMSGMDS